MKLSFHARGDALVTLPFHQPQVGQHLRRVGREASRDAVPAALRDAFEVDSESPAGQRLLKLARREPCLWPADQQTADAMGVPLPDLELRSGAWVEKTKTNPINDKAE